MVAELHGEDSKATFDPLMSLHWHFTNEALRCGGLYIMAASDKPEINDGHYCPVCEFVAHAEGFKAEAAIGSVADQMAAWCRAEGRKAAAPVAERGR